MKSISIILLLLPFIALSQKRQVTNLYQLTGIPYTGEIYSGYLRTGVPGKEHFYMYYKSQNPSNKLYVAIFGGPGCSVLENVFTQTGPIVSGFVGEPWAINEHNWNKDINVLYLDSPAGVGFSVTNDPTHAYNDDETASAHYESLMHFIELFSEYEGSEIYIGGESYAGVYIPNIVNKIYTPQSKSKLNVKGIFIGNGLVDKDVDIEKSLVEFAFTYSLISMEIKKEYDAECPVIKYPEANIDFFPRDVTPKCNEIRKRIKAMLEGNDIYDLTTPCYTPDTPSETNTNANSHMTLKKGLTQVMNRMAQKDDRSTLEKEVSIWPEYCTSTDDTYVNFLNNASVKQKLSVSESLTYTPCNKSIMNSYQISDSYNIYQDIINKGVRVWFYSGDVDACVSPIGSMRWIKKTQWKPKTDFLQWKYLNQVAGIYQEYENGFHFITVKGAGHLASLTKKPQMKLLLDKFIAGSMQ